MQSDLGIRGARKCQSDSYECGETEMYLVNGLHDPVDAGITPDGFVLRVDEDYLEILVRRVLIDPVRVEDS